jgi:hypothetical protein
LDVEEHDIGVPCLRLLDGAFPRVGLGDHDETVAFEQLTRGPPEAGVVVDEKETTGHETIVAGDAAMRSVASSTVSSTR